MTQQIIESKLSRKKKNTYLMASLSSSYRDRNYIIKDLILRLAEHGEMSQTALISCCRLNLKRHKFILYDMELNELVTKNHIHYGKRVTTIFKPTWKGIEFSRTILEPYEKMFPRQRKKLIGSVCNWKGFKAGKFIANG